MSKPDGIFPTPETGISVATFSLDRVALILKEHQVTLAQRVWAWDQDYPCLGFCLQILEPHLVPGQEH